MSARLNECHKAAGPPPRDEIECLNTSVAGGASDVCLGHKNGEKPQCGLRHVQKSADSKPKKRPPPRYIASLLKTAEYRKAEREMTKEKMVRLEREREELEQKSQAADGVKSGETTQVYVTQGYLKRMKERELALKELNK